MSRLPLPLAVAVTLALVAAAPASAGTYTVTACAVGEQQSGNDLLGVAAAAPAVTTDTLCSRRDGDVGLRQVAGTTSGDDTQAVLAFTAPAGATIASFAATRTLAVRNSDVPNAHNPYVLAQLGDTVFEGAGNYDAATRTAVGAAWYGAPRNIGASNAETVTPANRPRLAGYAGDATSLSFRAGCFKRGTPCTLDGSGLAEYRISGLSITLNDTTPPEVTPAAAGLLAGGPQAGSAPVTVDASDAAGIRSVTLIDVTNPAAPVVVGGETYDPGVAGAVVTGTGRDCRYTQARACPVLQGEAVTPTALPAGTRQVLVRATDPAGNSADAGPYRVEVTTPSNRGALNGAGATETGKLTMGFTTTKRGSRTIDAGQRPTVSGTLTNEAGAPIAGATLVVATRDTDSSAYTPRTTVTTGADGRYRLQVAPPNSRYVRVSWASHQFDALPAAVAQVKVRVRARAKLSAPRTVRVGPRFTLKGRLRGVDPPKGVKVIAQAYERGRYRPFATASADSKGRFRIRQRLFNASSRGRTLRLRVRIVPTSGWPYTGGTSKTVKVRVR